MGKKDTKSKYVNALNCVFIVIHIDSSIAAQDGFGFVTWCLQVKTCKQIYDEYISEKTANTHASKIVLAFNFFFFFYTMEALYEKITILHTFMFHYQ